MKKPLKLFFLIILFAALVWILWDYFPGAEKIQPSVEISKQVKYSFTIQNKTSKLLDKRDLWVYAPLENSFQSCSNIETNLAYQLVKSTNGNQILHFVLDDLPPFATRMVHLQTNIAYHSIARKMDILNREIYLLAEPYIESDHPDIVTLAGKLKASSPLETVRQIYSWVSSNIESTGYTKNSRGALYALKHHKGDCTEFMYLFIALCRASHIPARGIGGYICIGNCILSSGSYHNWAEFYINGSWLIADCQKKVFAEENSNYIAMQVLSNDESSPIKGDRRFGFQGDGLKVIMN